LFETREESKVVADLFKDIIPAIMVTKKDVLVDEKDYAPFLVNKALSFHYDCIMYANEMNFRPNLDAKLQNDFLLNTVRGYKRPFQKWVKRETVENIEAIKKYYKYSYERAAEVLPLLTDDQLNEIRTKLEKGGIDARSKRSNRSEAK
jgi:hypothetical protein